MHLTTMGRVSISEKLNAKHVQNRVLQFQSRSKPKGFPRQRTQEKQKTIVIVWRFPFSQELEAEYEAYLSPQPRCYSGLWCHCNASAVAHGASTTSQLSAPSPFTSQAVAVLKVRPSHCFLLSSPTFPLAFCAACG